ncbi:MAG: T9SS type A sorting domain-containing protein [Bacteroidia bacterium]|nr:T9SS type A sorting domain-containing protein [Bacteroidia bacterium]
MKRFTTAMMTLIAGLLLISGQSLSQTGGVAPTNGPSTNGLITLTTNLAPLISTTLQGDYVAAGVGMRNIGSGTINLSIPTGGVLHKAYLFWAIIYDDTQPPNTGTLNGNPISGILKGTSGSPCWGGEGINFYLADVTGIAVNGLNTLTGFPSGLTNGAPPQGNIVFPLLEGATLVFVFRHPQWDRNTVMIHTGANTFTQTAVSFWCGTFIGRPFGNPADQLAQQTYIMADGQARAPGGATKLNGIPTSGPGTAIKTNDAFDGADGIIPVFALDGLWDTHTFDVSTLFQPNISTPVTTEASAMSDCITWGAHIISVKNRLHSFVDIKPGSCPNPFNVNSKGNLPVAILGSPGFDVSAINPATVTLNDVPATGGVSLSDVSTPYIGFKADCMDCNVLGPDGTMDRVFHFNSQAVAATLGPVSNNDCVFLSIEGEFMDGTEFSGLDIIRVIGNIAPKEAPTTISGYDLQLDQNSPNPVTDGSTFSFTLPAENQVLLAVYNLLGQRVATIVDGTRAAGPHSVGWNGVSDSGIRLAPGVYMYRLETGSGSITKKLLLSK